MKQRTIHTFITGLLVIAAILVMAPVSALAIGTAANTSITNTPTVQYSVGGAPQPLYTAPTTSFLVDTKVIFTVQKTDGARIQAPPSGNDRALNFQLSNESNASIRFLLTASNLATGTTITFGGSGYQDSNSGVEVNASDLKACVDANANSACDAGEEYVTVAAGAAAVNVAVLVTGDTPAVAAGMTIGVLLTATAVDASNNPLTESASDTAAVDFLLADGAGTDDAVRSGTFTDRHAFEIVNAAISVSKNATTIWDPYNYDNSNASKAKAIPGALVQYEITISNAGGASAIISTLTDTLSTNVAIDPDLKVASDAGPLASLPDESGPGVGFKVTGSGAGNTRAVATVPAYFTTISSADGLDHNNVNPGGTITAILTTILTGDAGYFDGELKPGESVTITFNVVVQ